MQVFSLAALYDAIDARRRERGLSWAECARQIGRMSTGTRIRPVAPSTITSLRTKAIAEGDGVLQMLVWLDRTPESFVDDPTSAARGRPLPSVEPWQVLRFDTRAIFLALEARRHERGLAWEAAAREIGVGAGTLTALVNGGRTAFP